jgi:transcriptional regulator with XRE-family HTH domain
MSGDHSSYEGGGTAPPRLTQSELAERAGMTQPALSRLEAGGVVPTIPLLERISAALEADLIVAIAPRAA